MILVLVLMFAPIVLYSAADFKGTDDQAASLAGKVRPRYEAWIAPIFEPSKDIEPWLFGIQAGFGASIIGYILGYFRGLTGEGAAKG